jgi:hypothetical protein
MNRVKKRILQNSCLTILIFSMCFVASILVNCGRLPPEEFWTGDTDDTTGIKGVIAFYDTDPTSAWQGFLSRLDFVGMIDTLRFKRSTVFPNSEVASLEFKIKQAYHPSSLELTLTSTETDTNIVFIYDTTASVELITKIKGIAKIGCDSVRTYTGDTVIGTDTLMLFGGWRYKEAVRETIIRNDTVLAETSMIRNPLAPQYNGFLTKEFEGQIWRGLFFEPVDKNASPLEWELTKISGGASVRIPDSEDDAPYNYWTIVKEKGTFTTDTIYNRPDSIHFGIQRLYPFPDSVWSYASTSDSIEITSIYPILNPQDTSFYFAYGDRYYSLTGFGSDGRLEIGTGVYPSSINYFSVMICPRQGLIYKQAPFKLRVWQMPVRIE